METFVVTLVVWLWIGPRYEEVRIENMSRVDCVDQAQVIRADQARTRTRSA